MVPDQERVVREVCILGQADFGRVEGDGAKVGPRVVSGPALARAQVNSIALVALRREKVDTASRSTIPVSEPHLQGCAERANSQQSVATPYVHEAARGPVADSPGNIARAIHPLPDYHQPRRDRTVFPPAADVVSIHCVRDLLGAEVRKGLTNASAGRSSQPRHQLGTCRR